MRRRPRLVGLLWRWHRRLGVLAAFFVLVLSATGIVLNHTAELGLDRRFVDWPWLSQAYGDDSGNLPAFQLGEHWLTRAANGRVYFDAQEVAPCSGKLVGAVAVGELLYAGCAEELLLITAQRRVGRVSQCQHRPAGAAAGSRTHREPDRAAGRWDLVVG